MAHYVLRAVVANIVLVKALSCVLLINLIQRLIVTSFVTTLYLILDMDIIGNVYWYVNFNLDARYLYLKAEFLQLLLCSAYLSLYILVTDILLNTTIINKIMYILTNIRLVTQI